MEISCTYKYRICRNGRHNQRLYNQIDIAGMIWNHNLILKQQLSCLGGDYVSKKGLKKHISKLRHERRYAYWKLLGRKGAIRLI
jgi:hypothetical protein